MGVLQELEHGKERLCGMLAAEPQITGKALRSLTPWPANVMEAPRPFSSHWHGSTPHLTNLNPKP